ncbi:hypothetical protein AVEN_189010-1 [Araneus ventricosus]|uniref:Uncharacterized protein n=1 Tax=Araneus ventricosus TaxID=182803 RepID=A0A4Y2SDB4_ARAVE|nr:hypothetical protein AVEN_189010-1 [Araneus ventricosus]
MAEGAFCQRNKLKKTTHQKKCSAQAEWNLNSQKLQCQKSHAAWQMRWQRQRQIFGVLQLSIRSTCHFKQYTLCMLIFMKLRSRAIVDLNSIQPVL